ncbi:MAG: hypothetical protein RLZZ301_1767 [Bacteroidota bacterium]
MERLIALFFIFSFRAVLHADLLPPDLSLTLRQLPSVQQTCTVLELEIKNVSAHSGSILVPGHPKLGFGLFEVHVYSRDNTLKWSLDSSFRIIMPDSSAVDANYMQFWRLDSGESYKQLLVLPIAPRTGLAFQVAYQAHVCEKWFQYVFRWVDSEGMPESPIVEHDEHFAYSGSQYSHLLECEVLTTDSKQLKGIDHKIQDARWHALKKQLKHQQQLRTQYPVLNQQIYSQNVLMCLPSYMHHYYVVDTKEGIYYVATTYQLGKIYRVRTFLARLAHLCGAHRVFWQQSDARSQALIHFEVIPY